MHSEIKPQSLAALLLFPAALISTAGFFLIPWMLETKHRIQNEYWEAQLTFATVALLIAAIGLPCLVLRICCSKITVAIGSWLIVLIGYIGVFTYIVQSHFPWVTKLIVAAPAVVLALPAGYALRLDLSHTQTLP